MGGQRDDGGQVAFLPLEDKVKLWGEGNVIHCAIQPKATLTFARRKKGKVVIATEGN